VIPVLVLVGEGRVSVQWTRNGAFQVITPDGTVTQQYREPDGEEVRGQDEWDDGNGDCDCHCDGECATARDLQEAIGDAMDALRRFA
jgi:hypothetical protein